MMKHIIGQAILQIIVLSVIIFSGENFIPEYLDSEDSVSGAFGANPSWKWHNGIVGGTVRSGRMISINGNADYSSIYDVTKIDSRHFTFIFNTFVMLQIFNFINCRKIHEEVPLSLFSLTFLQESSTTNCLSSSSWPSLFYRSF